MKNKIEISDSSIIELSKEELQKIDGGKPAYDIGFFIRELGILLCNPGIMGQTAVISDVCLNYKPSN